MAIQNDDEDETKNMNRSISGGTSYIGGGYTGGGSMQNQEPKQTQDKGLGTGFKNISEYLSSPSESSRMAENIARGTDTQGMQAISQIKDYKTESAMKTNVPDFDPNVAGGWLYDVSTSGTAPGKTAQFTGKAPDTSYKGPSGYSSLAGYAPAQKSVADTQQRTKDSGTWEGTQEQLRSSTLPGTNYTPGMARFDTVITKSGPGAGVLDQSQKKWGNIGNFLGQAEGDVQSQIGGAQAKAKNVTARWQNAENLARQKADETNKYYSDLATSKQKQQEEAAKQQKIKDEQATIENKKSGLDYLNKQTAEKDQQTERNNWIGPLQPGGLKEGWIWSKEDIDRYRASGQKPQRERVTSKGTFSTPEGYY
jgi:hypothetical protein